MNYSSFTFPRPKLLVKKPQNSSKLLSPISNKRPLKIIRALELARYTLFRFDGILSHSLSKRIENLNYQAMNWLQEKTLVNYFTLLILFSGKNRTKNVKINKGNVMIFQNDDYFKVLQSKKKIFSSNFYCRFPNPNIFF